MSRGRESGLHISTHKSHVIQHMNVTNSKSHSLRMAVMSRAPDALARAEEGEERQCLGQHLLPRRRGRPGMEASPARIVDPVTKNIENFSSVVTEREELMEFPPHILTF